MDERTAKSKIRRLARRARNNANDIDETLSMSQVTEFTLTERNDLIKSASQVLMDLNEIQTLYREFE